MISEIRRVGGFRIEGSVDRLQLVLLSDAGEELIQYRLTPEIVFKLATEIPRYAKKLADGRVLDDFGSSEDLCKGYDLIIPSPPQRD